MPPLPSIPNVCKFQLLYNNAPGAGIQTGANVLHAQWTAPLGFTAIELVGIANGMLSWWGTHFKPSVSSAWQLAQIVATALDGSGVQGVSTGASVPGTGATTAMPPQCTAVISWTGSPSYRGGKPRTYLPGLPTTATLTNSAQLGSTFATTLANAAIAAIADMGWATIGGTTAQLGTVSYYKASVNPTPPHLRPTPLFWAFLSATVHERVDSQRRRSGKERLYGIAT